MQTSKKSEKSRGIVGFAYNTKEIDYVSIANQTLGLASRVLGLPYTLITDESIQSSFDNQRYSIDTKEFIQWRNAGRFHAYKLSPYDETLVIDVEKPSRSVSTFSFTFSIRSFSSFFAFAQRANFFQNKKRHLPT